MNQRNRKKYYPMVVKRDGERCYICKLKGSDKSLVIDHWDNNNGNNKLANLHLLCQSCNVRKNPRGKASPMGVSVVDGEADERRTISAEFEKNQESEPAFRRWLFCLLIVRRSLSFAECIDSGAEASYCSQETVKRYLRKLCSEHGMYHVVTSLDTGKKMIEFKAAFRGVMTDGILSEQVKNWKGLD